MPQRAEAVGAAASGAVGGEGPDAVGVAFGERVPQEHGVRHVQGLGRTVRTGRTGRAGGSTAAAAASACLISLCSPYRRLGVERKAPASSRLLPDIAVRAAGVAQGSPRSPTSPPDAWPGKRQSDGGVTFPVEVPANRD